MKIIKEFQEFVSRGNVIDLAVGVVIGGAFAKLVDGVVKGVIEPVVAIINGQGNTESLVQGLGSLGGGVLNFLLLAAVVFFVFVKPINKFKEMTEKKAAKIDEAPKSPTQEELLAEIRDILKKREA